VITGYSGRITQNVGVIQKCEINGEFHMSLSTTLICSSQTDVLRDRNIFWEMCYILDQACLSRNAPSQIAFSTCPNHAAVVKYNVLHPRRLLMGQQSEADGSTNQITSSGKGTSFHVSSFGHFGREMFIILSSFSLEHSSSTFSDRNVLWIRRV
jgi:hypothetical protein